MNNHKEREHALLSPSAANRWFKCPASAKIEYAYPDVTTEFAMEGTLAHELLEECVNCEILPSENLEFESEDADDVMREYVDFAYNYILKVAGGNPITVESKVLLDTYFPECFGTLDYAVYDPSLNMIHIMDFKYGKGIKVSSINNKQLMLYALGYIEERLKHLSVVKMSELKIALHIVQPRLNNYCRSEYTFKDLIKFEKTARVSANKCLTARPKYVAGSHCKFCKHTAQCKTLYKYNETAVDISKTGIDNISDEEKVQLITKKDIIIGFIDSIEKELFSRLNDGEKIEGVKLVEGRRLRKWNEDAEMFLEEKLGEDAFCIKKSLITITTAKKLLKIDNDDLNKICDKREAPLKLVPSSDKREAFIPQELEYDDMFDI